MCLRIGMTIEEMTAIMGSKPAPVFGIGVFVLAAQLGGTELGKRRILLDDDQRRRLALKGKVLGRKLLGDPATKPSACRPGGPGIRRAGHGGAGTS